MALSPLQALYAPMVRVAIEEEDNGSSSDDGEASGVRASIGRLVLQQEQREGEQAGARLDCLPECVLASIYARVPELAVPHRRVCSRFYQQLCVGPAQGVLRLRLRCGAMCCATAGAPHAVPALPAFVARLHPECQVQVQVTTCGGECSGYEKWVGQALDSVLDACSERGLTSITDLVLHVERPERAQTLPCETLAAILVCNPRLTGLSLRGFALDTATLPLLAEAINHAGLKLQSVNLGGTGDRAPAETLESVRHLLSTSLTSLNLSNSMLYDVGATGLAAALQQTPCSSMRALGLSATGIGPFATVALRQIVMSARHLERLDLSDNALMTMGLVNVAAAFTELRLTDLNLARTAGGERGMAIIASALCSLSCLSSLSLAALHASPLRLAATPAPGPRGGRVATAHAYPSDAGGSGAGAGGNRAPGQDADMDDVFAQTREGVHVLSNELSRMFSAGQLSQLTSLDLSHIPLRCIAPLRTRHGARTSAENAMQPLGVSRMCVGCLCVECVECVECRLARMRACKDADVTHLHMPYCGYLHGCFYHAPPCMPLPCLPPPAGLQARVTGHTHRRSYVCPYTRRAAGMEWLSNARWCLGALEFLDLSRTQMGVGAGPLLLARGLKRLWGLRRLRLAENRLMDQVLASDAHARTHAGCASGSHTYLHVRAVSTRPCTRVHTLRRARARTHMPLTPTHSRAHRGSWRWRIRWSTGPVCCTNSTCATTPLDPLVLPPSPHLHMSVSALMLPSPLARLPHSLPCRLRRV